MGFARRDKGCDPIVSTRVGAARRLRPADPNARHDPTPKRRLLETYVARGACRGTDGAARMLPNARPLVACVG